LLLILGVNILVWSVLVLSAAGRQHSPVAAVMSVATSTNPLAVASPASPVDVDSVLTLSAVPLTLPVHNRDAAALLPIGDDTLTIALLGTDRNRASSIWRTDSIILAFVVQGSGRIGLLSVPRDLWVHIPDHGDGRINTVDALGERGQQPGGGRALLDKTLRHNLGVPVDHVVYVDFDGFVRIVDAVGGVTVDVEKPIADIFPDPQSPTGEFHMDLAVGPQHLDGRTALAYCRSRLSTSDFDRARRQRQVLLALWKQAFTVDTLAQAPQLWDTFGDSFETDLSLGQAVQLAQWVYGIDAANVRSTCLDATMITPWTTPQGAQVLLPRRENIQQAILDLLTPSD
jgi:LCP family protein required for cell wall assembly